MEHVAALRRFNRTFTARIGVLDDRFLGGDRPVGHARVIFEIGAEGRQGDVSVADLRRHLDLDSGYLSRILHALERDGLITLAADADDGRRRQVTLTPAGRREWNRLDQRSDDLVAQVLGGLGKRQRDRLAAVLDEADRLLAAAEATFDVVDPLSTAAGQAMMAYFAELERRLPGGFDAEDQATRGAAAMTPPRGRFVLIHVGERVVGCGGVQTIGPQTAEVKRMWVDDGLRGVGLGPRLLTVLEEHARDMGHRLVRLDTNSVLTDAVAMYRRAGYREIPRYNDNPYPDLFFERSL